jgi:hypothetical protein
MDMNDKPTLAQLIEYRLALLEVDRPELDPDTYRMRRKLILLGFGNPVAWLRYCSFNSSTAEDVKHAASA